MFSLSTKAGRTLIALSVALACVPAIASANPAVKPRQDLRLPDTRDAANRNQSPSSSLAETTSHDRGWPDARAVALAQQRYYSAYRSDGNRAESRIAARQDLRSPDTRDIADGRKYGPVPTVVTLKDVKTAEPVAADGFDWAAATSGAGVALGLVLLAAAAVIITRRRAHRDQPVAAT